MTHCYPDNPDPLHKERYVRQNSSHLLLLLCDKPFFTQATFQTEAAAPIGDGELCESCFVRSHFSSQRASVLCAPSLHKSIILFSPHTENWTIISRIRGIILLSMRLDKGNFCNHELLLCKLIFCWHQGSTSPAKPSFSLRVGLAGGSLMISTQIVWSSLYQKSFISLTINSSGWLIEDIKWVVVGGEYLMIWMILILGMMWLFTAVFSHRQVQTQQRNVQQMIQTNYWHQIHASPNCAV